MTPNPSQENRLERALGSLERLDAATVRRVQRAFIGVLLVAALSGMAGGTWDAAWHVTLLRETFWSPPHLLLYAGTAMSLVVGLAALASSWALGWSMPGPTAPLLGRPVPLGFLVATAGALVVLSAAPLDDFWHAAFGRDVDVWSFPHLVALAGGVGINIGAVMAVGADLQRQNAGGLAPARSERKPHALTRLVRWRGHRRPLARGEATGAAGHQLVTALFLAILLWVAMFSLNWYTLVLAVFRDSLQYPVLACLVGAPPLVIASLALGRGGATAVAALYIAYAAAAHTFLASAGFALLPFPPLVIVPALLVDGVLGGTAHWRRAVVAGLLFAPALYAAEAASLAWHPHPPMAGPPTGPLALGYYQAVLDRPWDLPHVLVALPLAAGASTVGALAGWWVGSIVQWAQGRRPAPWPGRERRAPVEAPRASPA